MRERAGTKSHEMDSDDVGERRPKVGKRPYVPTKAEVDELCSCPLPDLVSALRGMSVDIEEASETVYVP